MGEWNDIRAHSSTIARHSRAMWNASSLSSTCRWTRTNAWGVGVTRARTRVRARKSNEAYDERTRELERAALERHGGVARALRDIGCTATDEERTKKAANEAARKIVARAIEANERGIEFLKEFKFDVTREIVAAARGRASGVDAERALAHRPTMNPLFLRMAYEELLKEFKDGDMVKTSEVWMRVRENVVLTKNETKWREREAKKAADPRFEANAIRVSAFARRGKELLDIERESEAKEASGEVEVERGGEGKSLASGVVVVGAARDATGAKLLVFRSFDGRDIDVNNVHVGDCVSIDVVGCSVEPTISYDGADEGDENDMAKRATVRFMGNALDKRAASRLGDPTSITLEHEDDEMAMLRAFSGKILRLTRVPDVTTYERQIRALDVLASIPAATRSTPCSSRIVNAVFDQGRIAEWRSESIGDEESPPMTTVVSPKSLANPSSSVTGVSFDVSQLLALRAASTKSYPVVCVQGPPGTGKTSVVVEIIAQAVARGERVLACAPSNLAVDNLVERLDGIERVRAVRVGAPERISTAALSSSLDARVAADSEAFFAQQRLESQDVANKLRIHIQRAQSAKMPKSEREKLQQDIDELKKQQRALSKSGTKRKKLATTSILRESNVVLTTNAGAGVDFVQTLPPFDLVVIDEAAQATEPLSWIPLVRGRRAVLIGDPRQLAPIVLSREAADSGLARSLMSRLMPDPAALPERQDEWTVDAYESLGVLSLTLATQYRSHEAISSWSSTESYGGRLRAADAVKSGLLCDLPGVQRSPVTTTSMFMLSTRSVYGRIPFECIERSIGGSFINEGEATITAAHVMLMLKSGVKPSDIVVISPYAAQVRLLRAVLTAALEGIEGADEVEVSSIDAFQGRESQSVVISMVRANSERIVGFLADNRRMNVAVTRAKRHVSIIGDHKTITSDPFLARLVKHVEAVGSFKTNSDYLDSPL